MKKATKKIHPLLERMGLIERMERGKVCRMTGRSQYNHQTWQNGNNVVRYVTSEQVVGLQEAINGYGLFMELAQQYAEQIIQRTRRELSTKLSRQNPSGRTK